MIRWFAAERSSKLKASISERFMKIDQVPRNNGAKPLVRLSERE